MAEISALGYLCIGASDLAAWEAFATGLVGLDAKRSEDGKSLTLRMDERAQRLRVESSPLDDLLAAGWEFDSADALDQFVGGLRAKGLGVTPGSAAELRARRVEKLYSCVDADGIRHEFYSGAESAPGAAFHSSLVPGGFVTGELGVGHYVCATRDYAQALSFHRDVLGLGVSDTIRGPLETPMGTISFDGTFFHAATGRHHSFATAQVPFPKRIHHIMVEMRDPADVEQAYRRFRQAGVPIMMQMGHHPNDLMTSFYAVTPSGFAIEIGSGGRVIDPRGWEIGSYSQLSDWGHDSPAPPA